MRTVALDYGNRTTLCEVKGGEVIARASATELGQLSRWIGPNTPPARVAVEACREAWWVVRRLEEWGHTPVLVDTTRVRQLGIGQHGRKTDRIDAEVLAVSLEKGLIPEAHKLAEDRQELRLQISARRALVEARAEGISTIRGLIRTRMGTRLRDGHPGTFAQIVREARLDETTRGLVEPLVHALDTLSEQIAVCDAKLEELSTREPMIVRLKTAPGVGAVLAAAFVSVVDDAQRFDDAHSLESYLGLVPSEKSSGQRRLGSITKRGNSYLRALLVQGAWSILRMKRSDPLREWARGVMARRGSTVAVVALARRLAGILWAMWRDNTVYEAARVGTMSARGVREHAQTLQYQAVCIARASRKRPWSTLAQHRKA
jgi:transposase